MDKELKAKWVAALRSGTLKQTRGALRRPDGSMCCLGVLREIIEPGSKASAHLAEYLSDDMALKAGLKPYESAIDPQCEQLDLSSMNDSGKSFAEIADHIEAKL